MRAGGHTTVIQRILERRAAEATPEETTATIAVMLRVMPPPRALLVCQDAPLLEQLAPRRRTPHRAARGRAARHARRESQALRDRRSHPRQQPPLLQQAFSA